MRMTAITGQAFINISGHSPMLVRHPCFIVRMTGDTGKFLKIARNMAVTAFGVGMFAGINRELVIENGLRPQKMGWIVA